ncbi:MAG: heme-copper oxidase subunit III [Dehalococcoidia bacterium]|nr:heme-copper oxidase subunit III [Dehalococcoidia bacterium]
MTVMAHAAEHGHGMSPAKRLQINRVGLWLFFFSESILFGLLLSSRFYLVGIEGPTFVGEDGAVHHHHLSQSLGLLITVILLASSITAFTAETAFEHGNYQLGRWMLLATIALGLVFAGGVAYEWSIAEFSQGDAFGSVFFAMTGMHAFHVVSGVAMLALVWAQSLRGKYSAESHWPVSSTVMYWHFVDVVWVFFYPALYLVMWVE